MDNNTISTKINTPVFTSLDSTKTFRCSYYEWNRKVNLSPPEFVQEAPENDKHLYDYFDALQYSLYETDFPETVDRTADPRTSLPESGVSIVVLASPVECMAILLEGGRKCPGDMLLVMSKSWITVAPSSLDPSLNSLYVHKAISFDRGGMSFIDVFDPPRRVTYFVNFFTRSITNGETGDGEELEVNLDCPMSSSLKLVKRIDDKLWTRIIMAEAGVAYPETLALGYRIPYQYHVPNDGRIKVIGLSLKEGVDNVIHDEVISYLNSLDDRVNQVVVKPSGVKWYGSKGVSFHDRRDFKSICDAAIRLLQTLDPGDGILLEDFCDSSYDDIEMKDYSFRIRANVCRGPGNTPITTTLVCGVGMKSEPIGGCNTHPQSLESTLLQWNLGESSEEIVKTVKGGSENVLRGIISHEDALSVSEKGGVGAQTDVIGIDYFLSKRGEKYIPVGIEVNSHDCIRSCQRYEFINSSSMGKSVGPLVETMIERSQAFVVQGKVLLLLGLGDGGKRLILEVANQTKIKVVLVDTLPEESVSDVSNYLQYDTTDHTLDDQHADNIIQILKDQKINIDGCCTFEENCVLLAAIINEKLGRLGAGVQGTKTYKKKIKIDQALSQCTGDIPHFSRAYLYVEKSSSVGSFADLASAVAEVGFPCMVKLEYGSGPKGMKICHDLAECTQTFNDLKNQLTCASGDPGNGTENGNSVVVSKYVKGTQHGVTVVMYKHKLIAAFVVDHGPPLPGSFTETAACMPSCLRQDKLGQLVTAAYQCCTEIGLENGVFNVEMKMTPTGPKLIEINARMGGFYNHHWILKCYGVDLVRYAFMIANGIKPIPFKEPPSCYIVGVMCIPSIHTEVFKGQRSLDVQGLIRNQSDTIFTTAKDANTLSFATSDTEEPFCNIAVYAESMPSAKKKLLTLCNTIGVANTDYNVENFVSDFDKY